MAHTRQNENKPSTTSQELNTNLTFKYLNKIEISPNLKYAILYGQLDAIKAFANTQTNILFRHKSVIVREVTHLGHLHILEYFVNRFYVLPSEGLLHIAATAGHLHIVRWLHEEKKIPLTVPFQDKSKHKNFLIWILRNGHINIAEWLIEKPLSDFSLYQANIEIDLIQDAFAYRQYHIFEWLMGKEKFYINNPIYIDEKGRQSLYKYLENHYDSAGWLLFTNVASEAKDENEFNVWLTLLAKRYEYKLANTTHNHYKQQLISDYEGKCKRILQILIKKNKFLENNKINTYFPLLRHLPTELLNHVCYFLTPLDIFSMLGGVNKFYSEFTKSEYLIASKHQQYFDQNLYTMKITTNFRYQFITNYNEFIKNRSNEKMAIHACITNNIPRWSYVNINWNLLTSNYMPEIPFYNFLLKTHKTFGIKRFVATLSLSKSSFAHTKTFIKATRLRQKDFMQKLLEIDADVINQKDENDESALIWAVKENYPDIVQFLLDNKADLKVKSRENEYTPLDWALHLRLVEILPLLLSAYNNMPDFKHKINYPMIWAVNSGYLDVVEILFQFNNEYAKIKNINGSTPLFCAVTADQVNIVEFLLQQSPSLIYCHRDNITPLEWARIHGRPSIQKVLTKYMYKNACRLPDSILNQIKDYIWLSKQALTLPFFRSFEYLIVLEKRLTDIINNDTLSVIVKIKLMFNQMLEEHNNIIQKNHHAADFLASLIKESLMNLVGHNKYLSKSNNRLEINIDLFSQYMQLLSYEEDISQHQLTLKY